MNDPEGIAAAVAWVNDTAIGYTDEQILWLVNEMRTSGGLLGDTEPVVIEETLDDDGLGQLTLSAAKGRRLLSL